MSTNLSEHMTNSLRIALIGYGVAGSIFHAPLITTTSGMSITAIVTRSPARQQQAHHDFPAAEIFATADQIWSQTARFDLVVIAAPNRLHVPLGISALNAGLPVVIDKPIAASVIDAERLIATSKKTGKLLSVFQNRRWDNDFLTIRHLLKANMLGQITRFESRFDRYRPEPRAHAWRELSAPEEAGGLLYDIGSHLIDQAVQLFGQPLQVYAEMERQRSGVQVDDDTFVALTFASGIHAHLWMSVVARSAGPRIRLSGLRGTYEKWGLDPQEDALRLGKYPGTPDWGKESNERWGKLSTEVEGLHIDGALETLPGSYESYYALLREALLQHSSPPVDPADAVLTLRIIEAAQQSARDGKIVKLTT